MFDSRYQQKNNFLQKFFFNPISTSKTLIIWILFVMAVAAAGYKKGCKRVLAALQQLFAFFSVFFRKKRRRLRQMPSLAIRLSA
jgi:putative effector of murein hydrolase